MSVLNRFSLSGKRLFISGGSRGLGREMALAIVERGAIGAGQPLARVRQAKSGDPVGTSLETPVLNARLDVPIDDVIAAAGEKFVALGANPQPMNRRVVSIDR